MLSDFKLKTITKKAKREGKGEWTTNNTGIQKLCNGCLDDDPRQAVA